MPPAPADTRDLRVIYAGREPGSDWPDGCAVLDEWEVLPVPRLAGVLGRAETVVILDPLSFPWETVTENFGEVPLVVVVPPEYDAEFLAAVFDGPVFRHLGFFDRVVVRDDALWNGLRRRHNWAEGQRMRVEAVEPEEVAREVVEILAENGSRPEADKPDRKGRGEAPAFDKAMHRVQEAVLGPRFDAVRRNRDPNLPLDVLEVGAGAGCWVRSFDPARTRFVGADKGEDAVRAARANFPGARFDRLGPDLALPYDDESFDLAFTVSVLHHNPTPAKRALLSEMWRVTRPGGRLIFLEDFVAGRGAMYPMSIGRFAGLVFEVTAGQVVLEDVEALRYPHDDVYRGGVICVSRLGIPKTW